MNQLIVLKKHSCFWLKAEKIFSSPSYMTNKSSKSFASWNDQMFCISVLENGLKQWIDCQLSDCPPWQTNNVRFFLCFLTDSSVLSWSYWPKRRREKAREKFPILPCTGTGVNQVDLMLKPFEPSVCCDPCGWSQEYPVSAAMCWAQHTSVTSVTRSLRSTTNFLHVICIMLSVVMSLSEL